MLVESRMPGQPALHGGMFVGTVVIHHQVHLQGAGRFAVDPAQEPQEFLVAMPPVALRDDPARGDIQRRKEGGGAVAHVVPRPAFHLPRSQGQQGLRAIQGLDLALLIHRQHQRVVRGVQVEPDDISHFRHKVGIGTDFERSCPVRLQLKGPPDALHGHMAEAQSTPQRARGPLGGVGWLGQGHLDDALHLLRPKRRLAARTSPIAQSRQPPCGKSSAPVEDGGARGSQALGQGMVGETLRGP